MSQAPKRQRAAASIALYRPRLDEATGLGLTCTGFGMQRISRRVEQRTLEGFAAVFIDEGAGWLETAMVKGQRIAAPALFWLHPGIWHSYGPDEGTAWHERWVLFEGGLADGFAKAGLLDPAHPVGATGDAVEIAALFSTLHTDFLDEHRLGGIAAAASVHRLIARSARLAPHASARQRTGDLDAALAALHQRAAGPVDLVALAAEFGFSPATLRRRMHEAHGVSPKALLMQVRCARAKELLAITDISIEEVARRTGFEDPYYFSRVFAGREGMSPSEFRRRNQRG